MAEQVRRWLTELDCERYFPIFLQNGFTSLASLGRLSDAALDRMAVLNPTHRQAILRKARQRSGSKDDFDSILGDLTSAIQGLEAIGAKDTRVRSFTTNPLLMDTRKQKPVSSSGNGLPQSGRKATTKPAASQDFDLNMLLADLEGYNPQEVIKPRAPSSRHSMMDFSTPDSGAPNVSAQNSASGSSSLQTLSPVHSQPQPQPSSDSVHEPRTLDAGDDSAPDGGGKLVVIKVFNNDGSIKTVSVKEGMTASRVCYLLVIKNRFEESPNWTLIERLGDGLERELEDHECVEEIYSHWAHDSTNQFLFRVNDAKYELFTDPIKYFPMLLTNTLIGKDKKQRAEKARKKLVEEIFSSTVRVPEIEGYLHLKDGFRTKWKKVYVILRASGLYQTLKGKQKSPKNLQLLVHFDECNLYRGINIRKAIRAQTEFCFALRPLPDQSADPGRDIKIMCADSEEEFLSWYAGIRLAKNGQKLYDNYYDAHLKQIQLEEVESALPQLQERAYQLAGQRLGKHLEKRREYYQKEKEARDVQEQMVRRTALPHHEEEQQPAEQQQVEAQDTPIAIEFSKLPPKPQSRSPPSSPLLNPLAEFPWYHGTIPREEAQYRLEQMGSNDGCYLVRDSSSIPNSYVLTMFAKSVPRNFQIMPYEAPGGQIVYRIDDGPAFHAVDQMLEHYKLETDRLPCKLTDFVPRPPTRISEC